MSRFDTLIDTVEAHQALATENYARIRKLAEELQEGLQVWLGARDGNAVFLVPPMGQFKPKQHGDEAFSMPPRGHRPLGPIAFGLAVRVSRGTDWLRLVMECRKSGDDFAVQIQGGREYECTLPLCECEPEALYQHIYDHIQSWFETSVSRYTDGHYAGGDIGFDFGDIEEDHSDAT